MRFLLITKYCFFLYATSSSGKNRERQETSQSRAFLVVLLNCEMRSRTCACHRRPASHFKGGRASWRDAAVDACSSPSSMETVGVTRGPAGERPQRSVFSQLRGSRFIITKQVCMLARGLNGFRQSYFLHTQLLCQTKES